MNKAPLHKHVKYIEKKYAKKMGVLQAARSISREKYTEKIFSVSTLWALVINCCKFLLSTWACLLQWIYRVGADVISIESQDSGL